MVHFEGDQSSKIINFLKQHAPFSVIDRGTSFADSGHVLECGRTGSLINGTVKDNEGVPYSLSFEVVSGQQVIAHCSCSNDQEMEEQWCPHAVALFVRAAELGFFEQRSGFPSEESTYRINTSSPAEIASVIGEVSQEQPSTNVVNDYSPEISIQLDLSGDRLGARVFFDGELQAPTIFEGFARTSKRALDNVLLQILEDEGNWDEAKETWFVNSSDGIGVALGLVQEYQDIKSFAGKALSFSTEMLDARLSIEWQENAAELQLEWIMPDGTTRPKDEDLIGTGPYWTQIDQTVFKLSPTAAKIATLFPYGSSLRLLRSQLGPVVEALENNQQQVRFINIANAELQPETEIKPPLPVLELDERQQFTEHFASQNQLELVANLEFEYPDPPEEKNIVYLPDHNKEKECADLLKGRGFEYQAEKKRYFIAGDPALDFVHNVQEWLPDEWKVDGVQEIKRKIRFANLSFEVSINSAGSEGGPNGEPGEWYDCQIFLIQNNARVPISSLFKNTSASADRWIRTDSGAYAKVPGGGLANLKTMLGMVDPNFKLSNTIKARITAAQAFSLSRIEDEQFTITVDKQLKILSSKLRDFSKIEAVKVSKSFKGELRHYQEDGLSWLGFLHDFQLGGILADEMGLGKTVQTLALIQTLTNSRAKSRKINRPTLIVAPTSVITNWIYEARRFAPKLNTLLLHGPQRKQHFKDIPDYNIVVTSYALLRLDRYDLEKHKFSYLILDEAQNIKNPQAATTRAAKSIRADHKLALSGTPTENRPLELWSIMDFLMPGYLGSYEFFRTYVEKPILEEGPQAAIAPLLRGKTRPFIMRRTKAEVEKDLPPKLESELHVRMTPSQEELYLQILEEVRPKVFDAVQKKGVRGASVSILAALLRLRQVCNHPNSIDSFKNAPGYDSGKFQLLKDLTSEAIENGRKVLLFSQFRGMLSIIREWLYEQGIEHTYLDGSTRNRQQLVDDFNNDEKIRLFLISLKAGGTGLNLTAADTVIIYDPWWNPAVEYQAVDRAHRIGQTKKVNVYRLVTENSIEQKIMALKEKKMQVVDALINENGLSTLNLSKSDLESLFNPFSEE